MGNEFKLSVAATAINKAFRQSGGEGFKQIGREIKNLFTRSQEIINPLGAYFQTPIERRINPLTGREDLYWQGYKRSIDESMRRHIAFLIVHGESQEKITQAKAERQLWQSIRDRALELNEGEAIQFFGLRTTNPEEGVSLQQLSLKNGQLELESLLLPFNELEQVDNFRQELSERGEDIGLPDNDRVDPLVLWATQGAALDFKQEVPAMISRMSQIDKIDGAESLLRPLPEMPPVSPGLVLELTDLTLPLPAEIPVPVSEVAGFWFEAMTAAAEPITAEVNSKEGMEQAVDSVKKTNGVEATPAPAVVENAGAVRVRTMIIKPQGDRENEGGRKSPAQAAADPQMAEAAIVMRPPAVITATVMPEEVTTGTVETAAAIFVNRQVNPVIEKIEKPDLVVAQPLVEPPRVFNRRRQVIFSRRRDRKLGQKRPFDQAPLPIYKMAAIQLEPAVANDKEIPFWQPTIVAAIPDYTIYILAVFFALLNTNIVQLNVRRERGGARQ